jgi:hypothetical protein
MAASDLAPDNIEHQKHNIVAKVGYSHISTSASICFCEIETAALTVSRMQVGLILTVTVKLNSASAQRDIVERAIWKEAHAQSSRIRLRG